ncbi:hypothetical protein [Nonlabens ponticola]|uniref:PepSY domain-containing protein n=1 Tax=Nonlabens ponticola TaxID=2496866 RepID=A0A3S9MYT6_9FLAO|nr:hypothetical protein [Nonlabens ponticola]AZQ44350.1 hypothetical protein EJ995_08905 [Nonlabens ponticola]
MGRKTSNKMRLYHRNLGFFLAGIMAVYAISGIALIFRDTDYLKKEVIHEKRIATNLDQAALRTELRIKKLEVIKTSNDTLYFKEGTYNTATGDAVFTKMQTPYLLDKLQHFHKAKTGDPLYYLNIFFGVGLLFFVVSAFWMFMPSTPIFKKGVLFAAAGLVLTLLLLFI